MLLIITNFKIILTINVIVALNNLKVISWHACMLANKWPGEDLSLIINMTHHQLPLTLIVIY